ncbi:arsenate reductase ArsC [Desulforhopalus sp. IMCC35007]|uniref:arsenate reductase ArsC n=1 Tax=Desulforhopalus sp. IMCC35007 TaxID=2569543 RepID=UPI0010AE475E|nr:arsenate reductase ArsC [Desulforhopalus sp. IMCC35007]TKB09267.1 arsenate reductase ArsC [Desulforhopalus sp. IMCC35007]
MLDVLVISENNLGKNLIASTYLRALGGEFFTVSCAGFQSGPLNPLIQIMMKLEGYDLMRCDCPYSVIDLFEMGRSYDIIITVCPKRIDEKCPDFPNQRLRLNWGHCDPEKMTESRIDRLQQTRIMRDNIKANVISFIKDFKEGKFAELK